MGKHFMSKIKGIFIQITEKTKGIFIEIIEKVKDLYNISFLPIWVEPSGRMTKEQETELMKLVKEDRKKTKQKKSWKKCR